MCGVMGRRVRCVRCGEGECVWHRWQVGQYTLVVACGWGHFSSDKHGRAMWVIHNVRERVWALHTPNCWAPEARIDLTL